MELLEELDVLLHNMFEFQEQANDGDNPHEDLIFELKSESIIFIDDVLESEEEDDFLALVDIFVQQINRINDDSDFELIESDESDQLVAFIVNVGRARGFEYEYDITEEYREW